jgi:hypothetical protein
VLKKSAAYSAERVGGDAKWSKHLLTRNHSIDLDAANDAAATCGDKFDRNVTGHRWSQARGLEDTT